MEHRAKQRTRQNTASADVGGRRGSAWLSAWCTTILLSLGILRLVPQDFWMMEPNNGLIFHRLTRLERKSESFGANMISLVHDIIVF